MNHKINIYSTALFSTWINVEDFNLLIDAGDGLSAGLLSKSRKIKNVFITHPDRDHLNGLPQFIQLNSRNEFPVIHYPKDSGSFPAMQNFLNQFDPHVKGSNWIGIEDGRSIAIQKGYEIKAIRNEHIKAPLGVHKSLSYQLIESKKKLKQEFNSLDQNQIKQIIQDKGRDFLLENKKRKLICFSGDTPVDDYSKWDNSDILIHESTFLRDESEHGVKIKGNKHSHLEEVMQMVKEINIKTLILNHFSSRYSKAEIKQEIRRQAKALSIDIPIYAVYPGEIKRNILSYDPINT